MDEEHALRKDEEGYYVWAATPKVDTGDQADRGYSLLTLHKFRVVPGERRKNFQGIRLFRELADSGELTPDMVIASGVPDGVKDGDQILFASKEWSLRPGQLIPVVLDESVPAPGIYIPMNAIKPIDADSGEIFLVADGKARKVQVRLVVRLTSRARLSVAISCSRLDRSAYRAGIG